jgi:hypothetical protein
MTRCQTKHLFLPRLRQQHQLYGHPWEEGIHLVPLRIARQLLLLLQGGVGSCDFGNITPGCTEYGQCCCFASRCACMPDEATPFRIGLCSKQFMGKQAVWNEAALKAKMTVAECECMRDSTSGRGGLQGAARTLLLPTV